MTAVPWNTLSETWTAPNSRPSSSRTAPLVAVNQDDVKTKVSGGVDRDSSRSEKAPDSQVPDSIQITADASGPRLVIPALSLRKAIAGLDDSAFEPMRSPLDSVPEDVTDIAQTIGRPLDQQTRAVLEKTDTLKRRRPWFRSSFAVWATAGVVIAAGFAASTTDTAEMLADRIYMAIIHTEAEAIPAAAADSQPAAMPPIQARAPVPVEAIGIVPPLPTPEAEKPAAVLPTRGPKPLRTIPARPTGGARRIP